MTRLVVGSNGMLGRAMARAHGARSVPCTLLDRAALDVTDSAAVAQRVGPGTELVINCTAYTDVDGAESAEADAFAVNATAVGNLARRCAEVGALLVHYSTDYVFSGRATAPYRTGAAREPINAYGRSKAAGEQILEASDCEYLLIRTSWLYAPWCKNFVRTMAGLATSRSELRVVNDQRGRPTSAEHLARVTLSLVDSGATGIHHVADGGECTWFDLAAAVAAQVNPSCRVEPCTSAEFPRPAPRPSYSVLDLADTEAIVGAMPSWQSNVADVVARIE